VRTAIGAIAAVVILGGGFFAYRKLTAPPPEPPPRPKPAAKPAAPPAAPQPEPVVEKPAETPAAAEPAPTSAPQEPVATLTAGPAAPALPPPPPAPSVAFRSWVENLHVSGVRAGASPRVFIGGTAYAAGDLVNPQLGIIFEGYDSEKRLLIFRDKSGATVERRN
jgi:hypothetical protein